MESSKSVKEHAATDGLTTTTPYIVSKDLPKLISFLKIVFNASEVEEQRIVNDDGTLGLAEIQIGPTKIKLFDAKNILHSNRGYIRIYVNNCQSVFLKAIEAGAVSVSNIAPLLSGTLFFKVLDPFDNLWWIQEHVEKDGPCKAIVTSHKPPKLYML